MKSQLKGGRVPWSPTLAMLMLQLRKTKKNVRKSFTKFLAFPNKILMVQKIVLSSSRGQGNFRGLEALKPRPRTSKCVLKDSTSGCEYVQLCSKKIMPKLDNDFREYFERKEGEKVLAKCKSCKLAATPVPNKTGKSYFHSGNLMQHLKRKHPRTA